jgi:hypothetical protein
MHAGVYLLRYTVVLWWRPDSFLILTRPLLRSDDRLLQVGG